ncbi:DegV family protein [uncultured Oscillibacter sp.]|uniref:DegV family protein n=1 Tax=uncultured Oscillibacter sp. TaxID=876091 RepID=UPI0026064D0F|nr:DegV family protein [uncultured Oscillibacter sp.]
MNQSYVILTESSSDLTPELAEQAGAEVLPLSFTMEGKNYPHYPDQRAMSIPEFYERMRNGAVAVTAAANVAELTDGMEVHLRQGKDVLFLCFSSGLSSTRDACAIAARELQEKYPERKIYTVDTLAASAGQALLVLLAGRKQKAGASIEEARDFVEETKLHVAHWFTVDDLTYLKRGGRVSPTAAAVGTMLNIKPVLHVDDEGHLIPMEKVRGRKAALAALVKQMRETVVHPEEQTMMISHACCREEAESLRESVLAEFHPKELMTLDLGPIIGAHTGPGLMALFFLAEHR